MNAEVQSENRAKGRVVTAETLSVAPTVLGQPLAEPMRRLGGMAVDLVAIGLLSLLSKPFLGLGTGALLIVLFGSAREAPLALKTMRVICRGLGAGVILVSALALGHASLGHSPALSLDLIAGRAPSAAMEEEVEVAPNAATAELRAATARLQKQVTALKAENKDLQEASGSWSYRARAFARTLGVTFGWSGVYFTLLAGGWSGRTLGKRLMGTRVVKINGTPLTFFDAFIRNGGYVAGVAMGMMGFLKILWEPNRQGVEDRIAGTVVVKGDFKRSE